jgi:hypothetical protein
MLRCSVVILVVLVTAVAQPFTRCALSQEREHAAQEHAHADADADHMHEFEGPPRQLSMLSWIFMALGWRYTLALPLAGLAAFILALMIVIRGGTYSGSALLFVVPIPLLVGMFGLFDGMFASFSVLAFAESSPKPWEVAAGFSTALVAPFVGMIFMTPAYLVATGGLFMRTLAGDRETKKA